MTNRFRERRERHCEDPSTLPPHGSSLAWHAQVSKTRQIRAASFLAIPAKRQIGHERPKPLDAKNNAARYERAGERKVYRAGHYDRSLTAKAGRLGLKVPKLKGEVFECAVIERHRRREESVDPPLSRQVPAR